MSDLFDFKGNDPVSRALGGQDDSIGTGISPNESQIHEELPVKKARSGITPPEIEIEDDDSFSYEGYQVVRGEFFAHVYEPSITLNGNRISVNTACIRRLPDVEYVQIWVNSEDKKLAVKPSTEDAKDSFKWYTAGSGKHKPKQIMGRVFFAKIMTLMNWNPNYRYKMIGKLIRSKGELLFVFDMKSPEIYVKTTNNEGVQRTSRTPIYPAEWQNQFGLPVEEHQKALQINIFEGYTVFSVVDKHQPKEETSGEHVAPEGGNNGE